MRAEEIFTNNPNLESSRNSILCDAVVALRAMKERQKNDLSLSKALKHRSQEAQSKIESNISSSMVSSSELFSYRVKSLSDSSPHISKVKSDIKNKGGIFYEDDFNDDKFEPIINTVQVSKEILDKKSVITLQKKPYKTKCTECKSQYFGKGFDSLFYISKCLMFIYFID